MLCLLLLQLLSYVDQPVRNGDVVSENGKAGERELEKTPRWSIDGAGRQWTSRVSHSNGTMSSSGLCRLIVTVWVTAAHINKSVYIVVKATPVRKNPL